jgi:hypothetical protein
MKSTGETVHSASNTVLHIQADIPFLERHKKSAFYCSLSAINMKYRVKCWNKYISLGQGAQVGRDSSVGIVTPYELDGPGIESSGVEIFSTRPDRPWGLPSLLYNGYWVIPGGKVAGTWR